MLESVYFPSHRCRTVVTHITSSLFLVYLWASGIKSSNNLRDDFSIFRNPATFLHAYTCLPLPYALRQATGTILQDICASGVLFSLLMCRHKVKPQCPNDQTFSARKSILVNDCMYVYLQVVSLAGAQKASLHPDDLLLLSNFVMSSESYRQVLDIWSMYPQWIKHMFCVTCSHCFLSSSRTSESFSPICLPRYNAQAFLHAYVHFFDVSQILVKSS